ncbi:MAG: tetratricopeptide repeat protein [Deltaproteobacteria bacterium]|nr:tetratricopeptide repeat protein [Deltaproteobacteria bacterium]
MRRAHPQAGLLLSLLAASCIAWLDPHARAREGNRLYAASKYEEAVAKYNEALVDQPDSAALHFNLGLAQYRQGKYDEAIKALQLVPAGDDKPAETARVAVALGNAKYKLGEAAEAKDPKAALTSYAEALVAYRRAMAVAPQDSDSKFNYEFVHKKLTELKQKLEEQQQQQQQQQQQPQDQDQQQDQGEPKEQTQQEKQQGESQPQPEQQQAQQPSQPEQQAAGAGEESGEKQEGEMSKQEAAAVLDSQRDQEVQPDEVLKKLHGAVVAEPAQDW